MPAAETLDVVIAGLDPAIRRIELTRVFD